MEENITDLASVINNPKTQIFFDSLIDSVAKILPKIAIRTLWVIFILIIMNL
ncbi:hypothetical protein EVA_14385 [gut metagenome]|uniref:Uncharacterized protein n=1 Tax=gut metagenome TaxID=749906 RepID=J9GDQ4_9ZZZZ